ncbi:Golgin subfamily A member 2 [Schistosoma japonicum]|nr:Golgin subfamily A member 2 [Schistosoma japonicum]KAH8855165.1 Golgin subfamily A member 2 [Schistosoma japonicum]KAH8855166.1 Golgin subfamily A member 2 [Schistosoma japonicum]KAH8855167.1 Golgin subfamily A member 2 [Schistosoma japonicum]
MPELSRADKLAAAQKRLKEFQATRANKQSDEDRVSQNYGLFDPLDGRYQFNYLSQHDNNHCILPVDNNRLTQKQLPQQYQEEHQQGSNYFQNTYVDHGNILVHQPQSDSLPASILATSNNDTNISLAGYFNSPTSHFCHSPQLQSLQGNDDNNGSNSISHNENGQSVALSGVTVHSDFNDKHQVSVSSSSLSSLSSALQRPSRNTNQTVQMPNNAEYFNYFMYNTDDNNGISDKSLVTAEPTVVCNVDCSTEVNNKDTLNGQLSYPQSEVVEDELEEVINNMPTAATEKLLQLTRQLDGILETSGRFTTSMHASSGAASPLNDCSSMHAFNTKIQSSSSSLVESGHYPESNHQYPHQIIESHDQSTKDYSHCSPNSFLSGQSSQMSISQNHLVRELEERNVELASMLEKRNRAYERLSVKLNSMKEQYERRLTDLTNERTNLQNSSQRDLEKTKEQIKAHAKTIGVLVAEKTELQSQVTHLNNLSVQRLREIEDVNTRLRASRQQILELERNLSESKTTINDLQIGSSDLQNQIKCLQGEIKREKNARQTLENELAETSSRLTAKSCELAQTGISLSELKQQLELSQIYTNQLGSTGDSLTYIEEENYSKQQEWLTERADLQNHLKELELSLSSAESEKKRLDSQYRNYVEQVEQQANDLRSQLSETNKLKQELELSLESVNRQLRKKDDEINDLTCRLNSVQIIPTSPVVHTQPLTASSAVHIEQLQDINSTSEQQSSGNIEVLDTQLKSRAEELENANIEIHRLNIQLNSLEETVEQLQNSLADRDAVLATATSERNALSRAVEQNKYLKQQLTDLQTTYTQMCNNYQSEIKSASEMNYALSKQIEHLNILQMENQNQSSENIISCTILLTDTATQTDVNNSGTISNSKGCVVYDQDSILDSTQHQYQIDNMTKVQDNNPNQLSNEVTLLKNLFSRISVICELLERQHGKNNEFTQLNDPLYCVNLLEESIQQLNCKHSINVMTDNSTQCSMYAEQKELTPSIDELQNLQLY